MDYRSAPDASPLISALALKSRLESPDPGASPLVVVDCRFDLLDPGAGRRTFLAGHIPGARYADLNQDLSAPVNSSSGRHPLPTPAEFSARMGALGIGDDTDVVAYDAANSSLAARLWWMLRWVGHDRAAVLDGGLKAWIAVGGGLTTGGVAVTERRFTPRGPARAVAGTAQIERSLPSFAGRLVDARAAERFEGITEPIDAVAGHIPGALNHPFSKSLDADDRFLAPQRLRSMWEQRLAGVAAGDVIAMCGSGVTACHHLLSMEIAGLPGGTLYAGSWSEWIRDRGRPIARS